MSRDELLVAIATELAVSRGSAGELCYDDFQVCAIGSLLAEAWADARISLTALEREKLSLDGHLCEHAEMGSYTGQVQLIAPPHMKRKDGKGICIDICLALEVSRLWMKGITTTGCCCGHGYQPPYIGVTDRDIPAMKEMGYSVAHNPHRPDSEDSFIPKTPLSYALERTPHDQR